MIEYRGWLLQAELTAATETASVPNKRLLRLDIVKSKMQRWKCEQLSTTLVDQCILRTKLSLLT